MKRQFRAFIVLISCFMTMLLLSPLACWADQNVGSNEYESVPETQSDPSDQTAAVADETAPSIDATVEPKEAAPDVSYKSHISGIGWEPTFTSNGSTSGTTGQSRRLEALRVSLPNSEDLGIEYRSHVQNEGWQDWVSNGAVSGTTGKGLQIEAVELKLTGNRAASYDLYYRVHASNFGWLGWTSNGSTAGTTGWSYAVEAIQIVIVKKGDAAPGDTAGAYVPYVFNCSLSQVGETTKVTLNIPQIEDIKRLGIADSIKVAGSMSYGGRVTRSVSSTIALGDLGSSSSEIEFSDYGPFDVTLQYLKNGNIVQEDHQSIGISASEYNLAPLSASFPVVLYSLSFWDISTSSAGTTVPSIVMLDRPSAYNWNSLPSGVYGLPYLTHEENASSSSYQAFADYVAALYKINPKAKFNLYINDITCSLIHRMIYANKIPAGQYSIRLLSDGSATYVFTNEAFDVKDPDSKQAELITLWNAAKNKEYETGEVSKSYSDYHDHWDSMYAVLSIEPGTQWWMTRTNLFTSGDDNAFANKIASDPGVKKVNVSGMLTSLQNRGEDTVQAFKALYNFNDGYFDAATQQGKKVMMLLGTYVSYEQNFDDYANLTEVIYGDDYLYYYKGHPNTPTGMYPQKQEQLDRLGITDVDSSVAAELILFFNPEIGLSGYGSSTYNSASADAAGGLWNSTKAEALKPGAVIDYSIMDWFASPVTEDTDAAIRSLCKQGDSCYLVEFSDSILASANYDFAIYSHNSGALTYFKKDESGYDVVKVSRGSLDVLATSHVSNDGWQSASKGGNVSGTVGQSKAVEAITLNLQNAPYDGSLEYRTHVSDYGWQDYVKEGEVSGTTGQSKSVQAIQIRLTGEMANHYDVYYRAHVQDKGWLGWACNDQVAGTTGFVLRLEAFQVVLVEKGSPAPGDTSQPSIQRAFSIKAHVSNLGWQSPVYEGMTVGTTGRNLAVEALTISKPDLGYSGGIEYRAHVQNIGWQKWVKNGKVAGTTGKSLAVEAVEIKLTGDLAKHYDVVYRAHVQSKGWLDWVKSGECAGTTGEALHLEALEVRLVEKS